MKVLQVHARYRGRGGEDTTVENERALLTAAGHSVRLFAGQNAVGAVGAARQLAKSAWNAGAARRLTRAIDEFDPDLVHVHNTWFALSPAVLAAASRKELPVVMTLQNYRLVCVSANLFRSGTLCEDCVGRSPLPGVMHRCYHDSVLTSGIVATQMAWHRRAGTWERFVDAYVAVSEYGVERHVAGGVPRERILVKDNFVRDPGPRARPPSESAEVLFVGRTDPEKGLDSLLRNWQKAAPEGLRLVVIGPVEAERRPATASIQFLGWLDSDEVTRRMKRARALVLPSLWPEAQPLVLLEALAAGLPVVGTAIGGIDEVLRDCAGSWRVPLGAAEEWQASLRQLGDGEAVDGVGARSRALYEDRFAPEVALRELLRVYRLAAERRVFRRR